MKNQNGSIAWRVFIPEMEVVGGNFHSKEPTKNGFRRSPASDPYKPRLEGFFPNFPVLISGTTGLPWSLGNLYLFRRLAFAPSVYESQTFKSISGSLLDYLRFLEACELDPLVFHPRFKVRRPTYLYRQHLLDRIWSGNLATSTASQHINQIIQFYRGLVSYGILESKMLKRVHDAKTVLIPIITSSGFAQSLTISSSDLAIKRPAKAPNIDCIQDGGSLFPLEKEEQNQLFSALKKSERCIFLLFLFALMTGARIQSVGTMRIANIKNAKLGPDGLYRAYVGPGTKVDTKNSKNLTLMVPKSLRDALMVYINSPIAKRRREISYYGEGDDNYVFLNRMGEPYYTSKSERKERRNIDYHPKVGIYSASDHIKPKAGDAIRTYIVETLLPRIRENHPEFPRFRFHDLRATFGMNCLEWYLKQMDDHNARVRDEGRDDFLGTQWVLERVMERLTHHSIKTTLNYLDFKRKTRRRAKLISEVEDELMQYVPASALEALETR